jgi:hypothetical protein
MNDETSQPEAAEAETTSAAEPTAPRAPVEGWAARKRTPAHVLAATVAHADWPFEPHGNGLARLATEAEFDAAVKAAGSIPLR